MGPAACVLNPAYAQCMLDNECSSLDDTETSQRLSDCLAGEAFCQ